MCYCVGVLIKFVLKYGGNYCRILLLKESEEMML